MAEQEPNQQESLRANLTTKIWGYAIGMLGISIPLTAIVGEHNGAAILIPISVVAGAAVSTIAVWNPFAARRTPTSSKESERVAELEERVASLEMILSYEEKLLESKMRQQPVLAEPTPTPAANSFALSSPAETVAPKPRRRSPGTKTKREVAQ